MGKVRPERVQKTLVNWVKWILRVSTLPRKESYGSLTPHLGETPGRTDGVGTPEGTPTLLRPRRDSGSSESSRTWLLWCYPFPDKLRIIF